MCECCAVLKTFYPFHFLVYRLSVFLSLLCFLCALFFITESLSGRELGQILYIDVLKLFAITKKISHKLGYEISQETLSATT